MAEYTVGMGGEFSSLAAAAKQVVPGDVVNILSGIYKERLTADTPGVTWQAAPGQWPVIDGGWDRKTKTGMWLPQVSIQAEGVVLAGLTIRNAPGRGMAIVASGVTLEDCIIDGTYQGALLVGDDGDKVINGVNIRRCTFRNMSLAWEVGDRGANGHSVNGSVNVHNVHDSVFENNEIYHGWGEGLNIGRGSQRFIVRGNRIYGLNHVLFYINRAQETVVENNVFYHVMGTKYAGPKGDSYSAAIVIGDEGGSQTVGWPFSRGSVIRRNLVVNPGRFLEVRNNKTNYNTALTDTVIEENTFVAGAATGRGIIIQSNQRGRKHAGSAFRNNVIHFDHAKAGADIGTHGQESGISFKSNAWSRKPPQSMQAADDVYGDLGLVRPDASVVDGVVIASYRPADGSPLIGPPLIGALPVAETPTEPDPPEPDYGWLVERLEIERELIEAVGTAVGAAVVGIDELITLFKSKQ